ncbi:type VI secretion system protein TssA [Denitromonas iodatirespirans]|uniref:Type VI secretion system protein TssA n=1 Tax=Denitromonas iodatirespirans TaxID=2795389 RepID=A0A944H7D8_DENI1|nr:type VI secretion system protein TssA [Denitromonas iodatirespirans]MBT0960205.1 type VI secretion system protein TssA [Denitromonas iodatirespirans]
MDIDALMRPVPGDDAPCGQDMMFSAEFDAIQDARRFDDPSLAQGEWVTQVKEADWPQVIRLCQTLLAERTKDLRVAVWLTEAMASTRGLDGLADGYDLLARLCDTWWDSVHPLPDDDDPSQRIGSVDWLVTRSTRLIQETPITRSAKGRYALQDLASARATASSMERNPGAADEVARKAHLTMAQFEAARKDTPGAYFVSCVAAVERASAAVSAFKRIIDVALGEDAPAFGGVFDALQEFEAICRRYAQEAGHHTGPAPDAPTPAADAPAAANASSAVGAAAPAHGPIRTRDDALRQLNDIAAFFKATEPHSPVAYLAEKAARWGQMSLHEWLRAVVKDDAALLQMEDLLGVPPRDAEAQGTDR